MLQLEPFKGGWINVSKQLVNNTSPNQDQNKSQTEVALSGFPLLVFLHSLDCLKFLVKLPPALPSVLANVLHGARDNVPMSRVTILTSINMAKEKKLIRKLPAGLWGFLYFKI